jgi:hypothetical protein
MDVFCGGYVCVYVYLCVWAHPDICGYTYTIYIYICIHAHCSAIITNLPTYTYTHNIDHDTLTHTDTHTHTAPLLNRRQPVDILIQPYILTYIHTHTYTQRRSSIGANLSTSSSNIDDHNTLQYPEQQAVTSPHQTDAQYDSSPNQTGSPYASSRILSNSSTDRFSKLAPTDLPQNEDVNNDTYNNTGNSRQLHPKASPPMHPARRGPPSWEKEFEKEKVSQREDDDDSAGGLCVHVYCLCVCVSVCVCVYEREGLAA